MMRKLVRRLDELYDILAPELKRPSPHDFERARSALKEGRRAE
jgi:hypothetical protein